MHDTTKIENSGTPAVPVATMEFMMAARAQAASLGRPDFDAVYVEHPVQDQTKEEIETRAALAIETIVWRLTVNG